jgi:hypothetical protein
MFLMIAGFLMPVLLVFGLYHLMTWFNVINVTRRAFWKRVGLASAISHIILTIGFFAFSYLDYAMNQNTTLVGIGFDGYIFNRSEFWRLIMIFDTAAMLVLLAIVSILDKLALNPPFMVAIAFLITLVIGTVQWYFVGGAIGLLLERFWSGLKTGDDVDEEWF